MAALSQLSKSTPNQLHSSQRDRPTLHSSRPRAVRWSGASAPRASLIRVSVWPGREGTWRLSERTLCRPEVHSEERSDEESLVQRALNGRSAADGASCGELAAVDDARAA